MLIMIHIREAGPEDAHAIAEAHVASWRATYRGIVSDEYLAGLSIERRERTWRDMLADTASGSFVYVAEEEHGHVIGFAVGGPRREGDPTYAGELYAIYVLPEEHGRGVGRMLVQAVTRRLAGQGMRSMVVWVLAENPSRGFYETLGGRLAGEQMVEIGGKTFAEVAYGWADTSALAEHE